MNHTIITEFHLLGFENLQRFKKLYFFILLFFYLTTISGNLIIIYLVVSNSSLQCPMYLFLTQLSISDVLMTTDIIPSALYIIWNDGGTMTLPGCLTQFYFFGCALASECFLLAIMAYDRYVAIFNPLRYGSIINTTTCAKLIIIYWSLSFSIELILTVSLAQLQFCGSNVIDHFFCDISRILELSCSDTHFLKLEILVLGVPVAICPLVIIIVSYVYIVLSVLKISSSGRWKTFSTCSSHLTVVSIFYGTLIGTYVLPTKGQSLADSKIVSLLYTLLTPLINPFIYSLRNKDINEAMKKCFCKRE